MQQKATTNVVMLRMSGEKRLREAMAQGLVKGDILEAVNLVLNDIENERANNSQLRFENRRIHEELRKYKGVYYRAIRDSQTMKIKQHRRMNIVSAIVFATVFAAVFAALVLSGSALFNLLMR